MTNFSVWSRSWSRSHLEPPFFVWRWSRCQSRPNGVRAGTRVGSRTLGFRSRCRSRSKKRRLRNTERFEYLNIKDYFPCFSIFMYLSFLSRGEERAPLPVPSKWLLSTYLYFLFSIKWLFFSACSSIITFPLTSVLHKQTGFLSLLL